MQSETGAETFSGPLNRLPTLVPERGKERQTDRCLPPLLPSSSVIRARCQTRGEREWIHAPQKKAAHRSSPPPPIPSLYLSSWWGWGCLERVGPSGSGRGATLKCTEKVVLSLRPLASHPHPIPVWHRSIPGWVPVPLLPTASPGPLQGLYPRLSPQSPRDAGPRARKKRSGVRFSHFYCKARE